MKIKMKMEMKEIKRKKKGKKNDENMAEGYVYKIFKKLITILVYHTRDDIF